MAISSTKNILGSLNALETNAKVHNKIDVHDAAVAEKGNDSVNKISPSFPKSSKDMGEALKELLTPKKGAPTLTPLK